MSQHQVIGGDGFVITPDSNGGGGSGAGLSPQTIRANDTGILKLIDAGNVVTVISSDDLLIPANSDVAYPVGTYIDILCIASGPFSGFSTAAGVSFTYAYFGIALGQMIRIIQQSANNWFASISPYPVGNNNGILKADGSGNITVGVSGSAIQKGDGSGGLTAAISNTDFATPDASGANAIAGSTTTNGTFNISNTLGGNVTIVNGLITNWSQAN